MQTMDSRICLIALGLLIAECTVAFSRPRIIGDKEKIINPKDHYELRCEGAKPLRWSYPQEIEPSEYSHVNITDQYESGKLYKYVSYLKLINASYTDTGFYSCFYEDNVDDPEENDNVYLYVADEDHLAIQSGPLIIVDAYYYEDFQIPCRPTSPDVHVKLYISPTHSEPLINSDYNPKTGYTRRINHVAEPIEYLCVFGKGPKEETVHYYIQIHMRTHEIAVPHIEDLNKGHSVVGDTLQLTCSIRTSALAYLKWVLPSNETVGCPAEGRRYHSTLRELESGIYVCYFNISTASLTDKGTYKCLVGDRSQNRNEANKTIIVFDKDENYLNLKQANNIHTISVRAGMNSVQWSIDVDAHPVVHNVWYNNKDKEIANNAKYTITDTDMQAIINIRDITINDRGYYTLKSANVYKTKEIKLFLNVTDKPTVYIESDPYHMLKETVTFKCLVASYPRPSIYWKCANASSDCSAKYVLSTNVKEHGLVLIAHLKITIEKPGTVTCYANNSLGDDSATETVRVSDVRNGFDIWGYDKDYFDNRTHKHTTVAVGGDLTLYCGVSSSNYTNQTYWYFSNYTLIENNINPRYSIQRGHTTYSYRVVLTIKNIQINDRGLYHCRVNRISKNLQDFEEKNISVVVKNPYKPVLINSNIKETVVAINLPQRFEATCFFDGLPRPNVVWLKDGSAISYSKRLTSFDNNQRIVFNETNKHDEGTYTCRAWNVKGRVDKQFMLKFKNKDKLEPIFIIIIVVLLTLLCILFIILTIKCMKERKLKKDLKIIGLDNFEKGSPDSINPDLRIDDQAELLPYERKWEFPREKLKLDKQLGSGAFGVVLKAKAYGILDDEESTTVAVKMVKKNADHTYIKALADELKIMIHLGKHLNVVNLLGACTAKVAKRELLVIVEFCKYGNLHNYLLRHRENFINQIDPVTETIDFNIGAEILKRNFSVSTTRSNSSNHNAKEMVDYRGNNPNYSGRTTFTDTTAVCMTPTGETGEDGVTLSNNSAQPEWRYNYRGDYKDNEQPISTKDLIAYAFQVARGMEYLASRKVLHGDLAARNILLSENNVVKICDFGLAKTMYKNDNYKKSGSGPLPVKWMAIESIRDRIFSTQSDVWSFGIVLWEFFSLARSPYPGMEANEQLYLKLVEGYRMDAPTYATQIIYQMMLECWHVKPNARPSFTKLTERLGNMLEDSVRKHYIDLNDPYLIMNTQRREEVQTDYLDMMRPPDCDDVQSPHYYVNDTKHILPSNDNGASADDGARGFGGYMVMSPVNQKQSNGTVFNFDVNPELRPMLPASESEPATPVVSPVDYDRDNSVYNPSYALAPKIEPMEKTDAKSIVRCADNYVNMPQNKNVLKSERINEKKYENIEMPYMNSNTRDWERVQA